MPWQQDRYEASLKSELKASRPLSSKGQKQTHTKEDKMHYVGNFANEGRRLRTALGGVFNISYNIAVPVITVRFCILLRYTCVFLDCRRLDSTKSPWPLTMYRVKRNKERRQQYRGALPTRYRYTPFTKATEAPLIPRPTPPIKSPRRRNHCSTRTRGCCWSCLLCSSSCCFWQDAITCVGT